MALDLEALREGVRPQTYNPALVRQAMAADHDLTAFTSEVHLPVAEREVASDMTLVEL